MIRKLRSRLQLSCLLLPALLQTGCNLHTSDDLHAYVSNVKNQPKSDIGPMPIFQTYESFSYSAASFRSPFEAPVNAKSLTATKELNSITPNLNRPRQILENFDMSELFMVGTLAKPDGSKWALVKDKDGNVHRVKPGHYMGKNHGQIKLITETAMDVQEIVPSGRGGWIERPRTVKLSEAS